MTTSAIIFYFNFRFTFADFKELTEVSPSWNEMVGKSRVMMEKVKLELDHSFPENWRLLGICEKKHMSPARRYQNAFVGSSIPVHPSSDKILNYFLNTGSLTQLEVMFVNKLKAQKNFFDKIDLSKLKVLKLDVTIELTKKLLDRCNSLTELHLREKNVWPGFNRERMILDLGWFLERNQGLNILSFGCEYFKEDISEQATYQLTHLAITNGPYSNFHVVNRNLIKFLTKQSKTLERLEIDYCRSKVVEHIFNKMPALKYLSFREEFQTEDLQLNLNENIVELDISGIKTARGIKKIISFVPNVIKLHIFILTAENILIIGRRLKALEKLGFIHRSYDVRIDGPRWSLLWPGKVPECFSLS